MNLYDHERPLDSNEASKRIEKKIIALFSELQKLYGILPKHRDKLIELVEIKKKLLETNYSYPEMENGIRQACLDSPKFFPRWFEIEVAIKKFDNSPANIKPDPTKTEIESRVKKEQSRRDRAEKKLNEMFSKQEIEEMVMEYCQRLCFDYNDFYRLDFIADINRDDSIALPIVHKWKRRKNENSKCKGEGEKTPTMGTVKIN